MPIVVVNESSGKSLMKSQRVLAKYLPQVGQFTFMGSLSREGVRDLEEELIRVRSRHTSVACMTMSGAHCAEVLFFVGNRDRFDEGGGTYAYEVHEKSTAVGVSRGSGMYEVLKRIVLIAALFHDLGKANKGFQGWLRAKLSTKRSTGAAVKGGRGQYLRHDAVGFLLLMLKWEEIAGGHLAGWTWGHLDAFLGALSRPLSREFQGSMETLGRLKSAKGLEELFESKLGIWRQCEEQPGVARIVHGLLFLVLTHHRLPHEGSEGGDSGGVKYDAATYLNMGEIGLWRECVEFSDLSELDENREIVAKAWGGVAELHEGLKEVADADWDDWLYALTHLVRPVLILGDHFGAKQLRDYAKKKASPKGLWANTRVHEGSVVGGDSLGTHLRSVFELVSRPGRGGVLDLVARLSKGQDVAGFDRVACSSLPLWKSGPAPVGSRFEWQDQGARLIEAHRGSQFFVSVIAETGAGKTIASAKIQAAISPAMRFTYCLGLRSLTLQTGQSYREDIGFTNKQCAVVIGDAAVQKSFDSSKEAAGAESVTEQQDSYSAVEGVEGSVDFLKGLDLEGAPVLLKDLMAKKHKIFLGSAVVVATIDQLIDVVRLNRISSAHLLLRVFSADLVIDEVDNFDPIQINHIGRLCALYGFAGRSVTVMSATMPALVASSLMKAWREGARRGAAFFGRDNQVKLAFVSNRTEAVVAEVATAEQCDAHVRAFFDGFAKAQETVVAKSSALVCRGVSFEAWEAGVLGEGVRLHRANYGVVEGKRVSVGFVRFNTVARARAFAKYALEVPEFAPGVAGAVLCYHAKYANVHLDVHDKLLNALTNRKGLASGDCFSQKALDLMRPLLSSTPCEDVVLIVATTSIIETGRDHDYDWCILEPNSNRSLVQGAGRVYRHRAVTQTRESVCVLESPLKVQDPRSAQACRKDPGLVWARPGPFDALEGSSTGQGGKLSAKGGEAEWSRLGVPVAIDFKIRDTVVFFGPEWPYKEIRSGGLLRSLEGSTNSLLVYENLAYYRLLGSKDSKVAGLPPLGAYMVPTKQDNRGYRRCWLKGVSYEKSFRSRRAGASVSLCFFNAHRRDAKLMGYPVDANDEKAESLLVEDRCVPAGVLRCLYLLPFVAAGVVHPHDTVEGGLLKINVQVLADLRQRKLDDETIESLSTYSSSLEKTKQKVGWHPLLGLNPTQAAKRSATDS